MKNKILFVTIVLSGCVLLLSAFTGWMKKYPAISNTEIERSSTKAFSILQKSGDLFILRSKIGCASCHHNTLTSMVAEIARQKGISVIDSFTVRRVKAMELVISKENPNLVDQFLSANFILPYTLLGLASEKYLPNIYTDISVDYMISQQKPDGSFLAESGRVPLETGSIHLTAMAIRAIQLYASQAKKKHVDELVARTRQFLEHANPELHQEIVFQLLGMQWCGSSDEVKRKTAEKLEAIQNADGGWSQLPSLKSDAYATGQTLYALYESRMIKPEDEIYQKGLNYLLKTQDPSGAWILSTRSYPIQPFINSDFPPYDENQFISATATNWATMVLMIALPDKIN